ncbi:MAG: hypothetical protein R3Y59_08960 [bacterium]
MPFIEDILNYNSISIIGVEKNCGKTVVFNYILSRLKDKNITLATTSIGVDGERVDMVKGSAKPEIKLYPNTLFATASSFYCTRRVTSVLVATTDITTAMGKVVIGKTLIEGKVLLGGASSTPMLSALIKQFKGLGAQMVLVDGALSRHSLASPAITDATILCTGAAVSLNIDILVQTTKFRYEIMTLPLVTNECCDNQVEVDGMLTDSMLDRYMNDGIKSIVVQDFTKIFISREKYLLLKKRNCTIAVKNRSKVVAICFNPQSPTGYSLNSEVATERLSNELGVKVIDVMKQ